ncbi:MAG TPA: MiaB/RimO family radical SAM methylthiotransferase [Gemmatimonadaceae bacterium]|nr:MiaB/RimO family radical SAM methylthiotransferase [Gemmatimonadaceae bacterium]
MRVFLRTFGCRANHYDTEAVRGMLDAAGHTVVASPHEADVAVFNSCAVTVEAEAELRKVVRRAARERPGLRSVVMGCAAALDEQRPISLQARALPTVERVVPGADLVALADALDVPAELALRGTVAQSGTRALLRVQDGCDEHCTFCATRLARGANRSRGADVLVAEATRLAGRHAEIVITGIHIGSYGVDLGSTLGALMTRLIRELPSARFRLSSIEATELDDELLDLLAGEPARLVPHIHAPLQSGSDAVLRRMGRHWYTSATYARGVERLATRMEVLGLGADVIAGFPGESDADHQQTLRLIERLPFTYLHVFPYSPRPGTAATRLGAPVLPAVAERRAAELRHLGAEKASAYAARRVGGLVDAIVVGRGRRREVVTGDYLTVALGDEAAQPGERFVGVLDRDASGAMVVRRAAGALTAYPMSNAQAILQE